MPIPNNRNWYAWEDRQPPNPPGPTLHVTGEVETNNGSIVPVLKPSVPQGINPKILILELTLEDTGKPGTDDVSYRPVKFQRDVQEGQHTQVQILWEGDEIAMIDVEIVH